MTDFDGADRALDQLVASPGVQLLVEHIESQAQGEAQMRSELEALMSPEAPELVRYLANLMIADEQRHHRLLVELANAISGNHLDDAPAVPAKSGRGFGTEDMLRTTRSLLRHERSDRGQLKALRAQLKGFKRSTAWPLILDLMKLDARKHILILRFLTIELAHDVHCARWRRREPVEVDELTD
jgi:hypothetical protein